MEVKIRNLIWDMLSIRYPNAKQTLFKVHNRGQDWRVKFGSWHIKCIKAVRMDEA